MSIKSYKDLSVWQKSLQLVKDIYELTKLFPKEEIYCLTQQLRRSGISVVSNIAEGSAKNSTKEFIRFLSIAYGSLNELEAQVIIAESLGYLSKKEIQPILEKISEIGKMANGLSRSLEQKLTTDHRPLVTEHA